MIGEPGLREAGTWRTIYQKFSIIHMFIVFFFSVTAKWCPSGDTVATQEIPRQFRSDAVWPCRSMCTSSLPEETFLVTNNPWLFAAHRNTIDGGDPDEGMVRVVWLRRE